MKNSILLLLVFVLVACSQENTTGENGEALTSQTTYKVGWSGYIGWQPWGYAEQSGILKKWADKEGVSIELTRIDNYLDAVTLYTSGDLTACSMRNIDALSSAVMHGVDSQAVIIGDFSNGNDGIVMKNGNTVAALKGRAVNLVENSVSHYLLGRALEINELSESDVRLINTKDSDIASLFLSQGQGVAVAWNPVLMQALDAPGAKLVFDSSQIPGEIFSMMLVNAEAPESLKRALSGAWYETIALLQAGNPAVLETIAKNSGSSMLELTKQLGKTSMLYTPSSAAEFVESKAIKSAMDKVRLFLQQQGMYASTDTTADAVGIQFNDGTVIGDSNNVKLRFTSKYMSETN